MVQLTAKTDTGAHLVHLAETLAEDFATRAAQHDREASFPFASLDALKRAGYLNGRPFARAYRDVRAGSFMHPLASNRDRYFAGRFGAFLPHHQEIPCPPSSNP